MSVNLRHKHTIRDKHANVFMWVMHHTPCKTLRVLIALIPLMYIVPLLGVAGLLDLICSTSRDIREILKTAWNCDYPK